MPTKQVSQTLEAYLRNNVKYNQDEWYDLLLLAEFARNNTNTAATKIITFFANPGYHLRTTWAVSQDVKTQLSKLYTHWMESVTMYAFENLKQIWAKMLGYFNKRDYAEEEFKGGNLVLL